MSSGMSLRNIKDKIKKSSLGDSVTERLNHLIGGERESHSASAPPAPHTPSHSQLQSQAGSPNAQHNSEASSPAGLSLSSLTTADAGSPLSASPPRDEPSPTAPTRAIELRKMSEASDADVYEVQLAQLQEQLVSVMILNQNMETELRAYKQDGRLQKLENDLSYQTEKNKELVAKISRLTASQSSKQSPLPQRRGSLPADQSDATASATPDAEGEESPSEGEPAHWTDRLAHYFLSRYYILLEDFSVTSDDVPVQEENQSLTVRLLKDNVKRFGNDIKPAMRTLNGLETLFMWRTPILTASVFLLYMYACWRGVLIPCLLCLLTFRLFLNLLEEWKVIPAVTLLPCTERAEEAGRESSTVSDKFNIVLQVATKVQNKFGDFADALEKINNLLTWKQVECTRKIFVPLCLCTLGSLVLPINICVNILGLALGVKLFVTDPLYRRFPRIKDKYDTSAQLWAAIMTDAQLTRRKNRAFNQQVVLTHAASNLSSASIASAETAADADVTLTDEQREFCDKFDLPVGEMPLKSSAFKEGKHCIYLTDMPLKVTTAYSNHAKLYLTPSFLCYELLRSDERHSVPLSSITKVVKRRAVSFLPGNGMALEFSREGFDKPLLFGGILHRDECYDDLMKQGRARNSPYALANPEARTELRFSELEAKDD